MTVRLWTKALDRHPPVLLNFSTELLSLAPRQHGTLELEASVSELGSSGLSASPNGIVKITMGKRLGGKVEVGLEAISNGTATLSGPGGLTCKLTVGTFESHLGTGAVDLLARTCNGSDIRKIVAIQQILHSEESSVIDQKNGAYGSGDVLACGDVVAAAGKALFGEVSTAYVTYHRSIRARPRPPALAWSGIKYDEKVMRKAIDVIKLKISKGIAVRAGMVYDPSPGMVAANGALQPSLSGGHFVLIVAFHANRFLFLDPFPTASMTRFVGGLPFNKNRVCNYMGVLEVQAERERGLHLGKVFEPFLGGRLRHMEAIAGPL